MVTDIARTATYIQQDPLFISSQRQILTQDTMTKPTRKVQPGIPDLLLGFQRNEPFLIVKLCLPGPYPAKAGDRQTEELVEVISHCLKRIDAGCSMLDAG